MAPQMSRRISAGNDPIQAQRYATQRPFSPEDLAQPLYDRVNYAAAGASELNFFSQQLGTSVTLIQAGAATTKSKTYRDTNMDNGGVVPTKRYTFTALSINYIPAQQAKDNALTSSICDDIMRLKHGGYAEFRIVDKPLLQIPLNMIPETMPIAAAASTANNVTMLGIGTTASVPYPAYKFTIPITLNPFENFRFTLKFDGTVALTQAFDIQIILHAFMRRPS